MLVTAYNPETDNLERSYLSTSHDAGSTILLLKNNDKFIADSRILIGEMGQERSEVRTTSAPTGSTQISTTAATSFAHDTDDPVILLQYDQVAFYRSDTEDGIYSLVDTVGIDVDNADGVTRYEDAAGTTTSWYKIKYVHSVTLAESNFSDVMQATGYTRKSLGKVIDEVVRRIRDESYSVLGIQEFIDIANEVNNDLLTQSHKPYRFLKTVTTLNTTADTNYIALPTDLWKYDRIEYTRTLGGVSRSYAPRVITIEEWDQKFNSQFWTASDDLTHVAIDESQGRIYLGPTPRTAQVGKLQLFYYKTFTELTDVGDEVETPNTLIYKYKMLAEYYNAKSESDNQFARLARDYESKYGAEVVKMQRVNRLDVGTTREIKPRLGYRKRYVL